jgi:MFS family permease
MSSPSPSLTSTESGWHVLRNPDFLKFAIARFGSGLGLQMIVVGVGWYVYELTNSALALGLVGLAIFLPTFSLALVTGHVADSFDRAKIIGVCYGLIAVVAAGLTAMAMTHTGQVWIIYGLLALMGTARAFANPASQALVPTLVPKTQFSSAVAFNSSLWQIAVVAGPSVGGLLYAFGAPVVFGAATIALALACTMALTISRTREIAPREKPTWTSLVAGIHFIRANPEIMGAISLDLFAVLLGGAASLMPIIARDVLHTGPWGLGLLRSGPAVGGFIVGLALTHVPIRRHAGHFMFAGVTIFGIMTIVFGLSTSLPLSLVALIIMGGADMLSVFVRQNLVQMETPDAMRGRVAAVNTVFIGASNELGDFESGLVAAAIGAVPAVIVGGVGTLAVAGLWAWAFPALRRRDRLVK